MYSSISEFGDRLKRKGITEVYIHTYIELGFFSTVHFHLKAKNGNEEFDECLCTAEYTPARSFLLASDPDGRELWRKRSEEWERVLNEKGIKTHLDAQIF